MINIFLKFNKLKFLVSITIIISLISLFANNQVQAKTTITFWHWYQEEAYLPAIENFEKLHPDIHVDAKFIHTSNYGERRNAAFIAQNIPDIFAAEPDGSTKGIVSLIQADKVLELTPYYKEWQLDKKFYPATIKQLNYNGKYYSIPTSINNINLLYNKDILDKYDLTLPKNYQDLLNMAKVLIPNGIYPISWGNINKWTGKDYLFLLSSQLDPNIINDLNSGKITIEDKRFVLALQKLKQMQKDKIFFPAINSMLDGAAPFLKKEAAMWATGTWSIRRVLLGLKNANLGVIPFPVVMDSGKQISAGGVGMNLAVSKNTKHKKEALEFLKYLTTVDAQKYVLISGKLSANIAISQHLEDQNKLMKLFAQYQKNTAPRVFLNPDLDVAVGNAIQGLVAGDFNDAQEAIEDIIDNL